MTGRRALWGSLVGFAALTLLLAGFSNAKSVPKQDRSWKRYRNPQRGYCVSYPSRWLKGEGFEGAGFWVESGVRKFSKPLGAIDVTALDYPSVPASAGPLSLAHDLELHLEGLEKFERAEQMELLEKRETQMLGASALYVRDRYYDPMDRAKWVDEIIFARRNGLLYRLELECRADQVERFEPVFEHVTRTFEFECPAAQH